MSWQSALVKVAALACVAYVGKRAIDVIAKS